MPDYAVQEVTRELGSARDHAESARAEINRRVAPSKTESGAMQLNEVDASGTDKVQRYGWAVQDTPGNFMMIPKTRLVVDHAYQRDVTSHNMKIKRLAANWSWIACGALIVANRDGRFYVVDGQHRAMAAMKRSDITDMPCLVFQSAGDKEEAEAFLRANKDRQAMTAVQSFNAKLVSGDPVAIKVQKFLDEVDIAVTKTSRKNGTQAVGTLMRCVETDEEVFYRVWHLIVRVCDRDLHNDIIAGIFEAERRLVDASLTEKRYGEKLVSAGREEVLRQMNNARAFMGVGGDRVRATGVLNVVNHKLRNKLELR